MREFVHNVLLVAKREYIERVRTKAFIIMTLLTPALMIMWAVVPSMMITAKTNASRHIVVATGNAEFGAAIKNALEKGSQDQGEKSDDEKRTTKSGKKRFNAPDMSGYHYTVDTVTDMSDASQKALQAKIDDREIDGFLWLDDRAIQDRITTYTARETNDFIELGNLRGAVHDTLMRQELKAKGLTEDEMQAALKGFRVDAVQWEKGHAKKQDEGFQFFSVFILGMAMYMTVLIFGIGVMRAILEEKQNRVMEVLMSTLKPSELMGGKIIGVGAVGLTQIAIWISMGAVASVPGAFSIAEMIKKTNWTIATGVYFAVFFVLGYFLYAAMCAALGAMVNSEQEAQQLQFLVLMPLILSFLMMFLAMRAPNDPRVVFVSFIPFAAPLVMYARIIVQTPPFWQIATSIGLMIVTIGVVVWVCGRIYRVGILMYGKKPTLPEIIKWVRYS